MERVKCSIDVVIPVYFGLGYTKRCIKSIIKNTDLNKYDYKLIVVDDSDSDEYYQLLMEFIEAVDSLDFIVILRHTKNRGFIEACYTGVEYRESDYKLLLNTDTYVANGAIEEMIRVAESDDKIAIVNPVTNEIPVIEVDMPKGKNILDMEEYLRGYPTKNSDYLDIVTSVGFAMLIKTKYIKEFGFWDRIFGKGYGEDTDLHFRYISKGLRAVIAVNSFIYHRGEGSFSERDEKVVNAGEIVFSRYRDLYEKDFPIFEEKTIINKIRSDILLNKDFSTDLLFLTSNNSIADSKHRIAHLVANLLIESGVSANIAYIESVTENSFLDDRLYAPFSTKEIDSMLLFPSVLVITDESLYQTALEIAQHTYKETGILPKFLYLGKDSKEISDNHYYDGLILTNRSSKAEVNIIDLTPFSNLDILSNVGLKKNHNGLDIGLALSEQMSKDRVKSLINVIKTSFNDLKILNIKKKDELTADNTENFFSKLKECSHYINLSLEPNLEEILLYAFSGSIIILSKVVEVREEYKDMNIHYVDDIDDLVLVDQINACIQNNTGIKPLSLLGKYNSDSFNGTILEFIAELSTIEGSTERKGLVVNYENKASVGIINKIINHLKK